MLFIEYILIKSSNKILILRAQVKSINLTEFKGNIMEMIKIALVLDIYFAR